VHDTEHLGHDAMSALDGIATVAEQVVDGAGYAGLAAVMAAESVLPIPTEVVLPVVGLQVSAGQLLFLSATLAATAGSVMGAWALYALGRWGGRPLVLRVSRRLGMTEARLARIESWSARRGDWIVLLGRLLPGIRSAVSVPAGTLRMPIGRFLALTAVGSFGWNAALIGAGVLLADRWQAVLSALSALAPYALVAAAAALGLLVLVRRSRSLAVAP
jgi:membrane protein DedA with SNARE-associated domain